MPNQFLFAKTATIIASLFLLLPDTVFSQAKPVTTSTELMRLYAIDQLPAYREESQVLQVSSYDRTGGNNDG
ncbi:MAG: hypothetical protein EOO14_23425, partial [Chitinophagaceae bacterium]